MKLMISVHGQQGSSIIPDLFLILNILKQKAEAQGEPEFWISKDTAPFLSFVTSAISIFVNKEREIRL